MFEIFLKHINYMASPTSPHPGFGFLCFRSKADQKVCAMHLKKKKRNSESSLCTMRLFKICNFTKTKKALPERQCFQINGCPKQIISPYFQYL